MTAQLFLSNSALSPLLFHVCSEFFSLCFFSAFLPPFRFLPFFSSIFHLLHSVWTSFEDPVEIGVKYVNKSEKPLTWNMLSPSTQPLFLVEAMALDVNVP